MAQCNAVQYSSPVQIPGTTWRSVSSYESHVIATKTDGTLWAWGENGNGMLGQNNTTQYSSPKQIPGTDWGSNCSGGNGQSGCVKTDGTLWIWGRNHQGQIGNNSTTVDNYSSPIQIPGTTWSDIVQGAADTFSFGLKTDGTAWAWGSGGDGQWGLNIRAHRSSPTQIGSGTNWSSAAIAGKTSFILETDNTP